jgi:hypothetical protein
MRSLLKASGIWGSGLDILLTALRGAIQQHGSDGFPYEQLAELMAARGKSIEFSAPEVEDMLSLQYGDRRLFPLLALLFPFVDLRNQFHLDHIFPISRFTGAKLRKAGLADAGPDALAALANSVVNIQLLDGPANNEKRASLPSEWLAQHFSDPSVRDHYRVQHLLGDIPPDLTGFVEFCDARRERLRSAIKANLNVGE